MQYANAFVAATDLFPFANQWPRQAIRPLIGPIQAERIDSFFLSRNCFFFLSFLVVSGQH